LTGAICRPPRLTCPTPRSSPSRPMARRSPSTVERFLAR
jgi:hypothetical protein